MVEDVEGEGWGSRDSRPLLALVCFSSREYGQTTQRLTSLPIYTQSSVQNNPIPGQIDMAGYQSQRHCWCRSVRGRGGGWEGDDGGGWEEDVGVVRRPLSTSASREVTRDRRSGDTRIHIIGRIRMDIEAKSRAIITFDRCRKPS